MSEFKIKSEAIKINIHIDYELPWYQIWWKLLLSILAVIAIWISLHYPFVKWLHSPSTDPSVEILKKSIRYCCNCIRNNFCCCITWVWDVFCCCSIVNKQGQNENLIGGQNRNM